MPFSSPRSATFGLPSSSPRVRTFGRTLTRQPNVLQPNGFTKMSYVPGLSRTRNTYWRPVIARRDQVKEMRSALTSQVARKSSANKSVPGTRRKSTKNVCKEISSGPGPRNCLTVPISEVFRVLLQEQAIDDEGLATLMCEVESITNGRPCNHNRFKWPARSGADNAQCCALFLQCHQGCFEETVYCHDADEDRCSTL